MSLVPSMRSPVMACDATAKASFPNGSRPGTRKTPSSVNRLRERVGKRFPQARIGRWHDELVGPHLRSMYQVAFPAAMLAAFVPWLMLNRDGLTILLHPETGDAYRDHTAHAAWFGEVLPLRLEAFKSGGTN